MPPGGSVIVAMPRQSNSYENRSKGAASGHHPAFFQGPDPFPVPSAVMFRLIVRATGSRSGVFSDVIGPTLRAAAARRLAGMVAPLCSG
jgi:hypothetical protein